MQSDVSTGEGKTLGVSLIGEVALQWVAPATCTKIGISKKNPSSFAVQIVKKEDPRLENGEEDS